MFALLFLWCKSTHHHQPEYFFLWSVGQGQWATWVEEKRCLHFDLGGEHFPNEVWNQCKNRENQIAFTHWDFDHTKFAVRFLKRVPSACILHLPYGFHDLKNKMSSLKFCSNNRDVKLWQPITKGQNSNADGTAFILKSQILITGDLPQSREHEMILSLPLPTLGIYVTGHHGSKTSTSSRLLKKMGPLKLALVSARFRKYGHPHIDVESRLKKNKTPILRTEDWGHIKIQM